MDSTTSTKTSLFGIVVLAVASFSLGCGPVGGGNGNGNGGEPSVDCVAFSNVTEGDITSDTTLGPDECYIVENSRTVSGSALLTMKAGTTLQFQENVSFWVEGGKLSIEGEEGNPVTMTGTEKTAGWWGGLHITNTESSDNQIDHAVIEYGGAEKPSGDIPKTNLTLAGSTGIPGRSQGAMSITVDNTVLRGSAGVGFVADSGVALDSFENNEVTGNTEGAGVVDIAIIDNLSASSTYAGNDEDRVMTSGDLQDGEEVTWPAIDVPYWCETMEITDGSFVHIDAGATFAFVENATFWVEGGKLSVEGSSDEKVTFTATDETRGWWGGLFMTNTQSSQNQISHAVVEYAGGSGGPDNLSNTNLGLIGNTGIPGRSQGALSVSVDNTTLRQSGGVGFLADSGVDLGSFENNEVTENAEAAGGVDISVIDNLSASSTFTGNDGDFVAAAGDLQDGEEVTWPAIDVPYRCESLEITDGSFVHVDPGATFEFLENESLWVEGGKISVEGTSSNQVTFTGTEATKGWWEGIFVTSTQSSENQINNTVVEYGGSTTGPDQVVGSNLTLVANTGIPGHSQGEMQISLDGVALNNSANAGLFVDSGVTLSTCNVTFEGNSQNVVGGGSAASMCN